MKFGRVDHPELIDFKLPHDHPDTLKVLERQKDAYIPKIYVGCAKWNRTDLKGFYPRGTKDELKYYSSQFNSIELNATFYRIFPNEQFSAWYNKTPEEFKFFPKLYQEISHWKRLSETKDVVQHFLNNASNLQEKLGRVFLQMHNNFTPKNFDRVVDFIEYWPKEFPLAIEFRHTDWYNDRTVSEALYQLLETHNVSNVMVDTGGRRDLLHMRLTNTTAFIRFVGANHETDFTRLDDWITRLEQWKSIGIKEIAFFIHQNMEKESPLLSAYFIKKINKSLGCDLNVPITYTNI
ncbi:DUF72 domain-containing protein [Aestuariivivens sediminis]|uniref:DUF72 domain-containing protein n=1 Tax=Aestuariivivens sediminis TaxID=2913557 RepID=UPI001F59A84D|nr:DUF72 domain-containing protein [Aestuariivivens sediminis]